MAALNTGSELNLNVRIQCQLSEHIARITVTIAIDTCLHFRGKLDFRFKDIHGYILNLIQVYLNDLFNSKDYNITSTELYYDHK
jgi:hypothetical protein